MKLGGEALKSLFKTDPARIRLTAKGVDITLE